MLRLLLWNLNAPEKFERQERIADVIDGFRRERELDLLLFVEPPCPGGPIFGRLLRAGYFHWFKPSRTRFAIFSTFSTALARPIEIPSLPVRYEGWSIELPGQARLNLFPIHGGDRLSNNPSRRQIDLRQLAEDVALVERIGGSDKSILAGDFNDGPFDASLIRFDNLYATNSRAVASAGVRTLNKREARPFYNPSWALLSDRHSPVPGTYYLQSPQAEEMHWNVLDQVLVRASLLDALAGGGLRVLTEVAGQTILNGIGRPDASLSDHLPVLLELDL